MLIEGNKTHSYFNLFTVLLIFRQMTNEMSYLECSYCRGVLNKPPEQYVGHRIRDDKNKLMCPELLKSVRCKYYQADGAEDHDFNFSKYSKFFPD
jgi:hypothetical protein